MQLVATNTLQGKAGTASAITYTVTGDRILSGADSFEVITQGQLGSSVGVLYTVPSNTMVIIKEILLANATGSDVTGVTFYVNGSAAANQINGQFTIPANGSAVYADGVWSVYNATGAIVGVSALTLTGDVTGTGLGTIATTIPNDTVTNAKLANMATTTFKGRVTAGTGDPEDLTATQATAILDAATQSLKGLLAAADKKKLDYIPNFVTDYGADPTGTTDIAAAVTAAVAAGVSQVFVPAGSYKCATTATHVISTHLTFIGAGRKDTIFKTNHATRDAFTFTNWGGGFVECGFDTLVARTGGNCINMPSAAQHGSGSGSLYCQVRHCDIYSQFVAIRSGDHVQRIDDVEIRYPGLTNSGQGGIVCDGTASANDKWISNILVQGNNSAGQFGIRVTQAASIVLSSRNDFINCRNAFDIIPGNGESVPSIYVTNTFFDNSVIGVNIAPTGTGAVLRCHFTQCWFSSNTTAGVFINSANVAGIDFVNCDVFGNAVGIDAAAAQDWSVSLSRFAGNTTAAIRTTAAATHGFAIKSNSFGTEASPQFGADALAINVQAGTYRSYQITENRGLATETTPGITDNGAVGVTGTKNIADNLGHLILGSDQLVSSGGAAVITGRNIVTSGTAAAVFFARRIPANAVGVGQIFRVRFYGQSQGAGIVTLLVKVGANGTTADNTIITIPASVAQVANAWGWFWADVVVGAIGGAGTAHGYGEATFQAATLRPATAAEPSGTIVTTAPWYISVIITVSASTFTARAASIEAL